MLRSLESVPLATPDELIGLLQRRSLFGRGCGFVDLSLIASVLLSESCTLWTLDKRLDVVAAELGLSYKPPLAS